MDDLLSLLAARGARVEHTGPPLVAQWRGAPVRCHGDPEHEAARLAPLFTALDHLPDPLPVAQIEMSRDAAGTRETLFVPIVARGDAALLRELSGDHAFLYFDRDHGTMTILTRDAGGGDVALEHRVSRIAVGHDAVLPDRSARADVPHLVAASAAARRTKLDRLLPLLRCVRCDRGVLHGAGDGLACGGCGARYPVDDGVPVVLRDPHAAYAPEAGAISSNTYSRQAVALFSRFADGLVLDCGSGQPAENLANVVHLEIRRYRNVDVVASSDALPFAPETFDAVVCESVLEHVPDPWQVVAELRRVLKPGGAILVDVPFLAPYHGYPSHYQNFTQQGVLHLMRGFELVETGIQPHQEPWLAIGWILRLAREGLRDAALRERLDRMTVGELLAAVASGRPPEVLTELEDGTRRAISAGFFVYARRPL